MAGCRKNGYDKTGCITALYIKEKYFMKVNMKQISEITGVSTATVSNALNYKRG